MFLSSKCRKEAEKEMCESGALMKRDQSRINADGAMLISKQFVLETLLQDILESVCVFFAVLCENVQMKEAFLQFWQAANGQQESGDHREEKQVSENEFAIIKLHCFCELH